MATGSAPVRTPTLAEIETISAISDPVLRNLRITDCYHRLSQSFTARTGVCANWCTFATWASRQAGCTIRGEDMLARLDTHLRTGSVFLHPVKTTWRVLIRRGVFCPHTRVGQIVRRVHTPFDAFERASDAVARGNLKVFDEIGGEFARYLNACAPDLPHSSPQFRSFLDRLRPGDPPEGQDLLRRAFTLYQQQRAETASSRRAQMIFFANLLIGLHEQTRLQPEIQEAMESAPATAADLGVRSLGWKLMRPVTRKLSTFARSLTRRVVTECLMSLTLPGGLILALGRDLSASPAEPLRTITVEELQLVLERFATPDCGADDWSDLNQRMRYIADLFRCFHLHTPLLEPPFTPKQLDRIRAGRVPFGAL